MADYSGPAVVYLGDERLGEVEVSLEGYPVSRRSLGYWSGTLIGDGGITWRLLGADGAELDVPGKGRAGFLMGHSTPIEGTSMERCDIKGTGESFLTSPA